MVDDRGCDNCTFISDCLDLDSLIEDNLIEEHYFPNISFITPGRRGNFGVAKYPGASSNNSMLITVEAINGGLLGFEVFHSFPEGTSSCHGIPDWIGSAPDVPQETSSEESFSWAREWLEYCCGNHARCSPSTASTVLPTRVVDVQDTVENGPVKLVETCGREGRYLCLSHCWGDAEKHPRPLETTNGNLRLYKEQIPWNSLPLTFQDAINFTRKLGERYIWIDSLCILQDCKEDWRRESKKMADIYSNSYLTLAATASVNSSGGLYSRQDEIYDTRIVKAQGGHVKCRRRRPHWPVFGISDGTTPIPPLLQRSWVYQERVLSPRVLHFGRDELLWECRQESGCECSVWVSPKEKCPRFDQVVEPVDALKYFDSKLDLEEKEREELKRKFLDISLITEWQRAVQEFAALKLTHASDRLPAIAGLAQKMLRLRRSRAFFSTESYSAGLWKDSLLEDLTWHVRDATSTKRDNPLVPSWSWACVDNAAVRFKYKIDMTAFNWSDRELWRREDAGRVAEVVRMSSGDDDGFLGARNGALTLKGRIFHGELVFQRPFPKTDPGNIEAKFSARSEPIGDSSWIVNVGLHLDYKFWEEPSELCDVSPVITIHLFWIHTVITTNRVVKNQFLVLRHKRDPHVYERVGLLEDRRVRHEFDHARAVAKEPEIITII